MSEHDDLSPESPDEPGTIGVGMGGSCPSCRAPVDLGQEFCLECGSPIRFKASDRRKQARAQRAAAPAGTPPKPAAGFPWIPFLVVLALLGGGITLALLDGSRNPSGGSEKQTSDQSLTSIQSERPSVTTDSTQTTTLQDCNPATPLGSDATTTPGETVPKLDDGTGASTDGSSFDAADSSAAGSASAVTVDQYGEPCPDDTTSSTNGGSDASGDWPTGRRGWTVIVFGYTSRDRATQGAADLREDGFQDGGVLWSSDFPSLCPGFFVVYSGVFDTESAARQRQQQLEDKDYAGMYVREVRTDGSKATGCRTAT